MKQRGKNNWSPIPTQQVDPLQYPGFYLEKEWPLPTPISEFHRLRYYWLSISSKDMCRYCLCLKKVHKFDICLNARKLSLHFTNSIKLNNRTSCYQHRDWTLGHREHKHSKSPHN